MKIILLLSLAALVVGDRPDDRFCDVNPNRPAPHMNSRQMA